MDPKSRSGSVSVLKDNKCGMLKKESKEVTKKARTKKTRKLPIGKTQK
jgi:hypothetical protein